MLFRACLAVVVLSSGWAPGAVGQALRPRAPLHAGLPGLPVLSDPDAQPFAGLRLTLKLVDGAGGRATADGNVASSVGADLRGLQDLAAVRGLTFVAALGGSEGRVEALRARAASASGEVQPDLMAILQVSLPSDDSATLLAVARELSALPEVEYAHVEPLGCPPPGDIAPATPNLVGNQGYRGPNPGVNVGAAWGQGLRGAGLRISDCEYGWNPTHEDLVDVDLNLEPGQTIAPGVFSNGWEQHGTAVLGELVSPDNGYGVSGLCPDAETATYPEWTVQGGFRRLQAITNAIADSDPGDVVLLEMQTVAFGGSYGPAELDPSVFLVCKTGVAAGVVVVGAAGNGNQNLDSATYATYQAWGDSGAIIVGAGSANASHNKLGFSTYGSRVNLQGWGENVFTIGYGGFAQYGGDGNQAYTATFNGTSSASPIVAGSCVLLQHGSLVENAAPLPPPLVLQILVDTGTPQGTGGHIGPLPELAAALAELGDVDPDPWEDLGLGLAGVNGVPLHTATGTLLPGSAVTLSVTGGPFIATTWWVLGVTNLSAPFKGGVLVPSPDALVGPLLLGFGGQLFVNTSFPVDIPAGTAFYSQFWIQDVAGPAGFSATNAMEGVAQ